MYVHGYYPDLPGWDPTWEKRFPEMYGYDPQAAKRLLAEAGYPKGFKAKAWLFPFAGAPELIPLMEAVAGPVARSWHRAGAGRSRCGGHGRAQDSGNAKPVATCGPSALEKSGRGTDCRCSTLARARRTMFETDEIYKMWEDLLQIVRPGTARTRSCARSATINSSNFEIIPLFDVDIEVVVDPKIVEDWPFSGWDGGDIGHTWLISACKQEKPCK